MRTPTYMILLAAPLALAACDAADDSTGTMMSDEMANSDSMPMSGEMPMAEETGGEQSASAEGTVTDIDPEAGTVTIEHGPDIDELCAFAARDDHDLRSRRANPRTGQCR